MPWLMRCSRLSGPPTPSSRTSNFSFINILFCAKLFLRNDDILSLVTILNFSSLNGFQIEIDQKFCDHFELEAFFFTITNK